MFPRHSSRPRNRCCDTRDPWLPAWIPALALTLTLAACGQATYSVEQHLERGAGFLDEGNLQAASIEFRNALQRDPESAEGRFRLGLLLLRSGDGAGAERELRRAIERGWDPTEARLPMLRALLMQARYGRVMEETEDLDDLAAEQMPEALALRGLALMNMGNPTEARKILAEALRGDANLVDAQIGMAAISHRLDGDVEAARAQLQAALEGAPEYAQAWAYLAELEQFEGRWEIAEQAYARAIELSPAPYAYHLGRATTRLRLGNLEDARDDLLALQRLGGNHPATAYIEGQLHYRHGRHQEAQQAFEAVLLQTRNLPPALLLLGASHLAQGHRRQAEHYLQRYLHARPDSSDAARLLAMVRLEDGDPERAEALLQALITRQPDDIAALDALGRLQLARGEHEQGLGQFRKLAAAAPEDPAARLALARALHQAGKRDEAIQELEAVVELAPEQLDLEFSLILELIHSGGPYDAVLERAEALRVKIPDQALPHILKAAAYEGQQDLEQAANSLREALRLQPGHPVASLQLSRMVRAQGDAGEARRLLREALESDPNHLGVLMELSLVEGEQGNTAAMVRHLEHAIAAHPEATDPRIVLGRYHLRQNQPARTVSLIEPLQETTAANDVRVLQLMANAYLATEQHAPAADHLRLLAEVADDTAPVRFQLGLGFLQAERPRDAETALRRTLELDPEHVEAMHLLAGVRAQAGDTDEAMVLARRMQDVAPEAPSGYSVEALMHTASGNHADAGRAYRAAYERSPTTALARQAAGAYQRADQPQEAAKLLEAHLVQQPDDDAVRLDLAQIRLHQGDAERGLALLEQVRRGLPDHPEVHYRYALALAEHGRPRDAQQELRSLLQAGGEFPQRAAAEQLLRRLEEG